MSKKQIKFVGKLPEPKIRKRDGVEIAYYVHIEMSTEEALLVSQLFMNKTGKEPKFSLIRAFLMAESEGVVNEELLLEQMVKMKTRVELAKTLSQSDVDRAICWLQGKRIPVRTELEKPIITSSYNIKTKEITSTVKLAPVSTTRRVFIPEVKVKK
jgi:hypothetical protein